ncbi:hypothetical protein ACN9MB_13480 [Dyella kyungheensis]|uniref:hypothetical protein n=1 Tax=Dyella kyungheensis TaxID=1242174 RepID=UPI003CEEC40F
MTVRKSAYTHRRQHALKLIFNASPSDCAAPYRDDEIAGTAGISLITVRRLRRIMIEKQLIWPDVAHFGDAEWTAVLNKPSHPEPCKRRPDWAAVHAQVAHSRTTIQQLWKTYRGLDPGDALSYKRFAALYLRHRKMLLRLGTQSHHPSSESPTLSTTGRMPTTTTRKSP